MPERHRADARQHRARCRATTTAAASRSSGTASGRSRSSRAAALAPRAAAATTSPPLPRAARAGPGARHPRGGPRRRGRRLRRRRPAELRAPAAAHAPASESHVRRLAQSRPGRLRDLRPPLSRRPLDDAAPLRRAARRLLELKLDGRTWQAPAPTSATARRCCEASARAGPRGRGGQAARLPVQARAALGRLAQDQEPRRQEAVIGGWLPGEGGRGGRIGALLVGFYDDGELATRAGSAPASPRRSSSGWSRSSSRWRATRARSRGRQPPKEARFVEPELVCRSSSASGPQAGTCATRPTRACATTSIPPT